MTIYGVALLAVSTIVGLALGDELGALLGIKANVGGVGFAMLLLIFSTEWLKVRGRFAPPSAAGVVFWSNMYIPIVVAMSAQQNVLASVKGGPLALLAGAVGTGLSFAMIPALARLGRPKEKGGA
jgi:hypothetical protein